MSFSYVHSGVVLAWSVIIAVVCYWLGWRARDRRRDHPTDTTGEETR